jgi:hypothetical protein
LIFPGFAGLIVNATTLMAGGSGGGVATTGAVSLGAGVGDEVTTGAAAVDVAMAVDAARVSSPVFGGGLPPPHAVVAIVIAATTVRMVARMCATVTAVFD